MRLTARPGAPAGMSMAPAGQLQLQGAAHTVIDGDVIDAYRAKIGSLHDLIQQSLNDIEALLRSFGLWTRPSQPR
jgi:hypothetical protein